MSDQTQRAERIKRIKALMRESTGAFQKPVQACLHPELEEWTLETSFGKSLKHPLVNYASYDPKYNHAYNCQLQAKKLQIAQAVEDKDWHAAIFNQERPWRIQAFQEFAKNYSDEQYWSLLAHVYIDRENLWENKYTWAELLMSERSGREHFMSKEEQVYLAGLKEPVTIYRGCDEKLNPTGCSWTLNKEVAAKFASQYKEGGHSAVLEKKVKKSEILAYKKERNEDEIVTAPPADWKLILNRLKKK